MKRLFKLLSLSLAVTGLLAAGSMPSASAAPGNNGTVKVDGVDILKHSNANEPHVGCDFSIEWYGFDATNTTSYVTFEAQPPTGTRILLQNTVALDGDDASGGGSPAGLDGVAYYQLSFSADDFQHPIQGYHVKLTVSTPTANGADTKSKVFWVQGCEINPEL